MEAEVAAKLREVAKTIVPVGTGLVFDNGEEPASAGPWVRCSVLFGESRQASLGPTARFRMVGVMKLATFGKTGAGAKFAAPATVPAQEDLCRTLMNAVRGKRSASPDIRLDAPYTDPGFRDPVRPYWVKTVNVPFRADALAAVGGAI